MNITKNGTPLKLVAFFLIAAMLVFTVGFASNGWQSSIPDSSVDSLGGTNDNIDNGGSSPTDTTLPALKPTPEYIDYLTGLETTKEAYFLPYIAFSMRSDSSLYGISNSALTIELPTENGQTRFLSYINNAHAIDKIGSLAPTRDYISCVSAFFSNYLAFNGNDDSFEYEIKDSGLTGPNFASNSGYSYTEYTEFVFTNGALIEAYFKSTQDTASTSASTSASPTLPFVFGSVTTSGSDAVSVRIPYSESNTTELIYSAGSERYMLSKGGSLLTDRLNDKRLEYDNVFLLFCDSVTYETMSATETILDTDGSGIGYYLSRGKMVSFTWSVDASGNLTFLNSNGEVLLVNPGSSYIAYAKSSMVKSITFS